ncbi:hypothetical protein [Flindersiella endophytica]
MAELDRPEGLDVMVALGPGVTGAEFAATTLPYRLGCGGPGGVGWHLPAARRPSVVAGMRWWSWWLSSTSQPAST